MSLSPGTLAYVTLGPTLAGDGKRGTRPAVVLGITASGALVVPMTRTVRRGYGPVVRTPIASGQLVVRDLRWVDPQALRPCGQLASEQTRRILEAARSRMVEIGARDLYRAAKRSL